MPLYLLALCMNPYIVSGGVLRSPGFNAYSSIKAVKSSEGMAGEIATGSPENAAIFETQNNNTNESVSDLEAATFEAKNSDTNEGVSDFEIYMCRERKIRLDWMTIIAPCEGHMNSIKFFWNLTSIFRLMS